MKLTKDVFLVPTRTTCGGFMTNFLFSPATISGFFSLMMLNTRFSSYRQKVVFMYILIIVGVLSSHLSHFALPVSRPNLPFFLKIHMYHYMFWKYVLPTFKLTDSDGTARTLGMLAQYAAPGNAVHWLWDLSGSLSLSICIPTDLSI